MMRDGQADAFKQRLLQIEKNIEEENGRAKPNRMPARYFMFFFLIGGEEESRIILKRKVKELLSNPDACAFMQITEAKEDRDYGKEAERILQSAAAGHIDVQDLNTVYLCPVIFANNSLGEDLLPQLTRVDDYMTRSGHLSIWQPTVIIRKNIAEYGMIYRTLENMARFITEMPQGRANRCCILSNIDENGFAVSKENIMQTVAMTVVLQNVVTKDVGGSQAIRSKVTYSPSSEDNGKLFFTARNAAVTNPTRSLLLQRMCSALDFFSKSPPDRSMPRIDYSFIPDIIARDIKKLPHHDGRITYFPLYSVMPGSDLQGRLDAVIREKYYEPLCGDKAVAAQLSQATDKFLHAFFAAGGSLSALDSLIRENNLGREFSDRRSECYGMVDTEAPALDKKKLSAFGSGGHRHAQAYCDKMIRGAGEMLLNRLEDRLSRPDMLHTIEYVSELIDQAGQCIRARLRQLKDVETVLVVEQTEHRTDFGDVQSIWLESEAMNNPAKYADSKRRFNEIVYNLLKNNAGDGSGIFDICYDAIKHSAYTNIDYLTRVSNECMANDERAGEFAAVVEKSWCYTLRFIEADVTKDATCIIGDSQNSFCRKLREKFNGTLFDFTGFDRIDVLHISGAFSPKSILEWEQIEKLGTAE